MSSLRSCNYRAPATLPLCKEVQLTVDDKEMKLIKGRILPPPTINNKNAEINMGRINLRGKFVDPKKIQSIAFVYFGAHRPPLPPPKKSLMEKFVESFNKVTSIQSVRSWMDNGFSFRWPNNFDSDRFKQAEKTTFSSRRTMPIES